MPYFNIEDLPEKVRSHLPTHAQEIYLAAFNHAWKEYADRSDLEKMAHQVAWSAVKKVYEKNSLGEWIEK